MSFFESQAAARLSLSCEFASAVLFVLSWHSKLAGSCRVGSAKSSSQDADAREEVKAEYDVAIIRLRAPRSLPVFCNPAQHTIRQLPA